MTCYRPSICTKVHGGEGGVVFGRLPLGVGAREFEVPCGKCIGCCMENALMWKTRIIHESKCWENNLFVTLTYAPEHLYPCEVSGLGQLYRPHFAEFMDRLRERLAGELPVKKRVRYGTKDKGFSFRDVEVRPIRYFMCGEYGDETARPHYHAVLFNCKLPDGRLFRNGTIQSKLLEDVWQRGQVQVSRLNSARAGYVAGYVIKKAARRAELLNRATGEVYDREPEFRGMSCRPGLGAYLYARFADDFIRTDRAVIDGKEVKVPRFYWLKMQGDAPAEVVERIKEERVERARSFDRKENSVARRAVREEYQRLRYEALSRRKL